MTETRRVVRLQAIIDRVGPLAVLGSPGEIEITDVCFDDREVILGSLFCCLVGAKFDGHDFALRARRAGAVAFICEHSLGAELAGTVQLVVGPGQAREAMARAACTMYGDPATSLRTVGVTGTNGKTTTTYLLRAILEHAGLRTGVIGTLDGARTTPEAPHLQRLLARQVEAGCRASAMEVSSHALVQRRVDGIVFDAAIFTNLSQDHLDFHETMESYFQAKAELFTPEHAKVAIVNRDDQFGRRLIERHQLPTVSFGLEDAKNLVVGLRGSQFYLGNERVRLCLGGEFNVHNALGAAAAANALGIDTETIAGGLAKARAVPGRFESMAGAGITAVVDYAHTPAGLEQVLRNARQTLHHAEQGERQNGRTILVFGCGGERDRSKRPAMGAIAARGADLAIVTSDNPRSEDPKMIIDEIVAGMTGAPNFVIEPDRRRAIHLALSKARPGDVVVIAGKGHETTQQFADHVEQFDDRVVVRAELEALVRNGNVAP